MAINTIIISPWSQKLLNNNRNPKNYPYWNELIEYFHKNNFNTIQIGLKDEEKTIAKQFLYNQTFEQIENLINNCCHWISVDNFLPHFINATNKKPGTVIFSLSDPNLYGYPQNLNILKNTKYLRQFQFRWWHDEQFNQDAFELPHIVFDKIMNKLKN